MKKSDFWKQRLAPYARANDRRAAWQIVSTGALFVVTWWLMLKSLAIGWWVPCLLAPLGGGLLVRLFIIQHDCGHGSFFRSRRLNDSLGFALGIVTLTPYLWWKRNHAVHHGSSGDLDRRSIGDVRTLTMDEYQALPWTGRTAYRLYRHPLVLLGLGPIWLFGFKHRLPIGTPWSWRREWRDVLLNNVVLAAIVVVFSQTIGLVPLLLVHAPVFLVSATAGVWLFYVQHQFEDTLWAETENWDFFDAGLHGSSFYDLPRVLHWFTGNIGYHHLHHLASHIPNYALARCCDEVSELRSVPKLGMLQSVGCLRLKLWDREAQKLVPFPRSARSWFRRSVAESN